jgi:hypothetical protein
MGVAADTGTQPAETPTDEYILRSYRYLRLAIVILLIGLAAGIVGQRWSAGCIEDSISAFYYTPVHGLFIGALVATGAAMVALNGRTTVENSFFNIAGVLAPVVVLVPTNRQMLLCDGTAPLQIERNDLVPLSLVALLVAGAATLAVTAFTAARNKTLQVHAESFVHSLLTGVLPLTLFAIATFLFVGLWNVPWYSFAHFGSAIGLFVAIFLAIGSLLSERLHRVLHVALTFTNPTEEYRKPAPLYYKSYLWILFATAPVAAITALVGDAPLFWIEVSGIASFTSFWIVQTAELWRRLPEPTPGVASAGTQSPKRST